MWLLYKDRQQTEHNREIVKFQERIEGYAFIVIYHLMAERSSLSILVFFVGFKILELDTGFRITFLTCLTVGFYL